MIIHLDICTYMRVYKKTISRGKYIHLTSANFWVMEL